MKDYYELSPPVSSDWNQANEMIKLSNPQKTDVLLDAGCFDGVVLEAACNYDIQKIIGIEANEKALIKCRERMRSLGIQDRVEILDMDLMKVDLTRFDPRSTIVTAYFTQGGLSLLRGMLSGLEAGSRVITNSREMPGWKPYAKFSDYSGTLYAYKIGLAQLKKFHVV